MARDDNRQALLRIATVLLSLADLAERAAARPRPVLWLVLCILRPAEAIARRFVLDVSRSAATPAASFDHAAAGAATDPADALRLAVSFRLLAAVLGGLAAADAVSCGPHPSHRESHHVPARRPALPAPIAADTS